MFLRTVDVPCGKAKIDQNTGPDLPIFTEKGGADPDDQQYEWLVSD